MSHWHVTVAETALAGIAFTFVGSYLTYLATRRGSKESINAQASISAAAARNQRKLEHDRRLWDQRAAIYLVLTEKIRANHLRLIKTRHDGNWASNDYDVYHGYVDSLDSDLAALSLFSERDVSVAIGIYMDAATDLLSRFNLINYGTMPVSHLDAALETLYAAGVSLIHSMSNELQRTT